MADSQRKTANLAPISEFTNNIVDTRAFLRTTIRLYNESAIIGDESYNVTETGTFSYKSVSTTATPITRVYIKHDGASRDIPILDVNVDYPKGQFQFTADYQSINPQTVGGIKLKNIMLNYGSTPLPYEPYSSTGWYHSLRKLTTATEAVENPLYSDGTAITSYTIKGNTVQNGTPTPSNPVDVVGVGERTENLFDYNVTWWRNNANDSTNHTDTSTTCIKSDIQDISDSNSYISLKIFAPITNMRIIGIGFFGDDVTTKLPDSTTITITNTTIIQQIPTGAKHYYILLGDDTGGITSDTKTALASAQICAIYGDVLPNTFIPYGYKIPISSVGQTIDIYIGDLPLLKSLDGTAVDEINNGTLTRRVDSDGSVLPTPTTTQITAPSIPTTEGANSITVDTTVQPSEFTATWTGWHDSSVKEYDGSQWNE